VGGRTSELLLLLVVSAALLVGAWRAADRCMQPAEAAVQAATPGPAASLPPVVRDAAEARTSWFEYVGLLVGAFLAAHLLLRLTHFRGTRALLPLALLLTGAGAILLFGFTNPLRGRILYAPYVHGVLFGLAGLVGAARFVRLQALEQYRYLIVLTALGLSALLLPFGSGPAGTDTRITLFGAFQPVEFVILLVVLFLAAYLAGRDIELRRLNAFRLAALSLPRWRDILPPLVALGGTLGLFFLQRDLGPALVLYLVFLGLFVIVTRRIVLAVMGLGVLVGAFWATYHYRLLQTVSTRIEMWLSPWDNHRPGGIQLAESLWSLASGGAWGAGLGRSDARYIPAGHTDLILAAAGETFGILGVVGILLLLAGVSLTIIRGATRARRAYTSYLGIGLGLLVAVQTAIIAGGTVGILPLTGVPLPFLSYGKSATIAFFVLLGLAMNVSAEAAEGERERQHLPRWVPAVPVVILLSLGAAAWKAFDVMVVHGDEIVSRAALTPQADGIRRFSYNRRLLDLAARITRGSVVDRSGLPLGSSVAEELGRARVRFDELGIALPDPLPDGRYYPLGGAAAHLLGHTGAYWTHPRTIERAADVDLRGYAYREDVVAVDRQRAARRDYSALVPAFRDRFLPSGGALQALLARDKTVRTTIDARMQAAAMRALDVNLPIVDGVRRTSGAAIVLDPASGGILASVSLPTYDPNALTAEDLASLFGGPRAALDRARNEVYPPGSAFKLVTAAAAIEHGWLRKPASATTYVCRHVNVIHWESGTAVHNRHVTDDELVSAHGALGIERALVESCNVYFAWMGTVIGARAIFDTARRMGLALADVDGPDALDANLADNAYGQALITASPVEMAALAAAVSNGGVRVGPAWRAAGTAPPPKAERVLNAATAETLRRWMVETVRLGTGRRAAVPGVVVGGKTGTAQNSAGDRASHAWFVGFAYPDGSDPARGIAFAFLIENGGYGGRAAAQAAHDFIADCYAQPAQAPETEGQ